MPRPNLDHRSRLFSAVDCEKSHEFTRPGAAMDFSLQSYFPIFLFLAFIIAFCIAAMLAAHLVGPRKHTPVKDMIYESGMDPIGDARQRFDVKFYLIAILFLVFDVELLFLYPWAASYRDVGEGAAVLPRPIQDFVFWEILAFLLTVVVAYVYAWRRGVFRWR
jgi:NADH:ubiquinone oxidoreductase subunit 3 (subunit A)